VSSKSDLTESASAIRRLSLRKNITMHWQKSQHMLRVGWAYAQRIGLPQVCRETCHRHASTKDNTELSEQKVAEAWLMTKWSIACDIKGP